MALSSDSDSRQLLTARLRDLSAAARKSGAPRFTAFLDPGACTFAAQILSAAHDEFTFFGGYPDAERRILSVYTQAFEPSETQFPMTCIGLSYRPADTLTHRDVLGSVMALQIRRDAVGDILVTPGKAQLFVLRSVAPLLCDSLRKIGRVGVCVAEEAFSLPCARSFQPISGTVASCRLDAMVSLAARVSREKAAALIRGQQVAVGGLTAASVCAPLEEGEIFSVRGFGKYRVAAIAGLSKKGRLHVTLEKYT